VPPPAGTAATNALAHTDPRRRAGPDQGVDAQWQIAGRWPKGRNPQLTFEPQFKRVSMLGDGVCGGTAWSGP